MDYLVRSLRLNAELDERVRQAAALEGSSVSEFLRQAASERAEKTLAGNPRERLNYAIGVVKTNLNQARDSGAAFSNAVERKHRRQNDPG